MTSISLFTTRVECKRTFQRFLILHVFIEYDLNTHSIKYDFASAGRYQTKATTYLIVYLR